MSKPKFNIIEMTDAASWRAWLKKNHDTVDEVWLVYYKTDKKHDMIDYESSVEEALCYGWIDSLIRKLDDERYARKFTPRKAESIWSESNKKRVTKLIREKRMTRAGQALIDAAKKKGWWDRQSGAATAKDNMPSELATLLAKNKRAREFFESLAPSYQKAFMAWVGTAKKAETRTRRANEAILLLSNGEKLGMK